MTNITSPIFQDETKARKYLEAQRRPQECVSSLAVPPFYLIRATN